MLSDDELTAYALRLYGRRAEGIITRVAKAQIGDWVPLEHECHANITTWCEHYPHHQPVHGWLYFDFTDAWVLGKNRSFASIRIR